MQSWKILIFYPFVVSLACQKLEDKAELAEDSNNAEVFFDNTSTDEVLQNFNPAEFEELIPLDRIYVYEGDTEGAEFGLTRGEKPKHNPKKSHGFFRDSEKNSPQQTAKANPVSKLRDHLTQTLARFAEKNGTRVSELGLKIETTKSIPIFKTEDKAILVFDTKPNFMTEKNWNELLKGKEVSIRVHKKKMKAKLIHLQDGSAETYVIFSHDLGSPDEIYKLAMSIATEADSEGKIALRKELLKKAADKEHREAALELAWLYQASLPEHVSGSLTRDEQTSIGLFHYYLEKAASARELNAVLHLAIYKMNGTFGYKKDPLESNRLFNSLPEEFKRNLTKESAEARLKETVTFSIIRDELTMTRQELLDYHDTIKKLEDILERAIMENTRNVGKAFFDSSGYMYTRQGLHLKQGLDQVRISEEAWKEMVAAINSIKAETSLKEALSNLILADHSKFGGALNPIKEDSEFSASHVPSLAEIVAVLGFHELYRNNTVNAYINRSSLSGIQSGLISDLDAFREAREAKGTLGL